MTTALVRAAAMCAAVLAVSAPIAAATQLTGVVFASGFSAPVAFVQDPSDPDVQYVVELGGLIRVIRDGSVLPTPFIDLGAAIAVGGERGLLGLALAPDYAVSGRAFVNFTRAGDGHTVVARFTRSLQNPLTLDPASRLDLQWSDGLRYIEQPATNHNGGALAFGPDGALYVGMGDGGGANDPLGRAQSPASLLGKMLRIDVSVPLSDPTGMAIPVDNPFLDGDPIPARPEIWAFGLRNPWKFSFDSGTGGTGAMIVADVGQAKWEEVNYEPAGGGGRNYGWPNREGSHENVPVTGLAYAPPTEPAFEYDQTVGGSITGGYVYRGDALDAGFRGRYFFGDFNTGRVWSLGFVALPGGLGEARAVDLREHTAELSAAGTMGLISSFGRDAAGELYVVSFSTGRIVRIGPVAGTFMPAPAAPPADFDRNGQADITWRHRSDGWVAAWLMNGTAATDSVLTNPSRVADPGWRIAATTRLNPDFKTDIIWHHATHGWVAAWIMTGTAVIESTLIGPGPVTDTRWTIGASGDIDGDGRSDLIWRHGEDGWIAAWRMDGTRFRDSVLLTPSRVADRRWRVVGTGDFNGDGRTDVLWWHETDGWVAVWLMDGTSMTSSVLLSPSRVPDTAWSVAGVGDYNGDGRPDLLWHHRTEGWVAAWLMDGLTLLDSVLLSPGRVPDVHWQPIAR